MNKSSNSQQYCYGKSGLTLVETIIAIAIIGMLALFFSPRFIQATRMMEHSRRSNISANLANSEMEHLRSLDFDELLYEYDITLEEPIKIKTESIAVENHIYDIKTIIIAQNKDDSDGFDGFIVRVIVDAVKVIEDEPIQQSIQSYISR